jgi:hypothetical protein
MGVKSAAIVNPPPNYRQLRLDQGRSPASLSSKYEVLRLEVERGCAADIREVDRQASQDDGWRRSAASRRMRRSMYAGQSYRMTFCSSERSGVRADESIQRDAGAERHARCYKGGTDLRRIGRMTPLRPRALGSDYPLGLGGDFLDSAGHGSCLTWLGRKGKPSAR